MVEAPKGDITESDLFTGLDGLLGEEDLDPVVMIIPVGGECGSPEKDRDTLSEN